MRAFEEVRDGIGLVTKPHSSSTGLYLHVEGHAYPFKGIPKVEAVHAANQIKSFIKTFSFRKLYKEGFTIMRPHILPKKKMTACASEIEYVLYSMSSSIKLSKTIAHVFEYDGAYRFRLQDLASETTKEALIQRPYREVKRLLKLNKERDREIVSSKIGKYGSFVALALLIPPIRRRFRDALTTCNFSHLQFDENDRYWACQKYDYNYFGKSFKERSIMVLVCI